MIGFVQGHGYVDLALRERPTGAQFALLAVDHIYLLFGLVVDIDPGAPLFERHGFQGVPVNLDVRELLSGGGVHDAHHRIGLMNIATAVVDIKEFCRWIVSNGIRVLEELDARERFVRRAVEDFQVPGFSIRDVQAVEVFAIQHGVGLFDSGNFVNEFAGVYVENQDRFVFLRRGEEAIALQVDRKMVKVSFYVGRQLESLGELERRIFLAARIHGHGREKHQKH